MHHTTATLRAEASANSSTLIGVWQNTERHLTGRIPVIEQRLFGLQGALAGLRVGRAQTGQLGSPPTVYDFAPFTDRSQEVRTAAGHAQSELPQALRDRDAEK
eukprot:9224368-Pyramimonas_sp.AAC.1